MRFYLYPWFILVCLMSSVAIAQDEESDVPESPAGILQYITIHSDGEKLLQIVDEKIEGAEPVEQTYTVRIPITEDGVTRMRDEIRTRLTVPTKRVMQEIRQAAMFVDLSGKEIKRSDLVTTVPMTGLQVIYLGNPKAPIPEIWSAILKQDVIVMKLAPNP